MFNIHHDREDSPWIRKGDVGTVKLQDLQALPPTVSVEQAAVILGVSRSTAFNMARQFLATGDGLPVLRCGRRLLVPVPRLLRLLGIDAAAADEEETPHTAGSRQPEEGNAA